MSQDTDSNQGVAGQEVVRHSLGGHTEAAEEEVLHNQDHRIAEEGELRSQDLRIAGEEGLRNRDPRIAGEGELHIVVEGEERHSQHCMKAAVEGHCTRLAANIQSWIVRSWGSGHSQMKSDLVVRESSTCSLWLGYRLYPPWSLDLGS